MVIWVDRVQAGMRGGWRALMSIALLGAADLLLDAFDWRLMWGTDRASCLALAALTLMAAMAGAAIAWYALKWLALAAWPAQAAVISTRELILLRLGPFGRRSLDRARLQILPLSAEEEESAFDDEPTLPRVLHPDLAGDLLETIVQFCRASPSDLRAVLNSPGGQ